MYKHIYKGLNTNVKYYHKYIHIHTNRSRGRNFTVLKNAYAINVTMEISSSVYVY